jgi:hypothetical protein
LKKNDQNIVLISCRYFMLYKSTRYITSAGLSNRLVYAAA